MVPLWVSEYSRLRRLRSRDASRLTPRDQMLQSGGRELTQDILSVCDIVAHRVLDKAMANKIEEGLDELTVIRIERILEAIIPPPDGDDIKQTLKKWKDAKYKCELINKEREERKELKERKDREDMRREIGNWKLGKRGWLRRRNGRSSKK